MSDGDQDYQTRGSVDFVETSILDTIIPSSTTVNIEEALRGSVERLDEGIASPLASITQRQILFFGRSSALGYSSMSYLFVDPR